MTPPGRSAGSRRARLLAAALAVVVVAGVAASQWPADAPSVDSGAADETTTARVVRGPLSATVSQDGLLNYRGRSDGSPYVAVNQTGGVYTDLPIVGAQIGCGGVLYRVDDRPVVLLCGTVPAYRALTVGRSGADVEQLNRNLRRLGYASAAGAAIGPSSRRFTAATAAALQVLQRRKGVAATGRAALGDVVFLPGPLRVSKVVAQLGTAARRGAPALQATSDRLHVQVQLDPSRQGAVGVGDRAQITLPGQRVARGRVATIGRVATASTGAAAQAADATIPISLRLDDPRAARGLDRAPVGVEIATRGVDDALSVPVTAIVGAAGGGFAVEAVRGGGRRELVAVTLGLFDGGAGRVQVRGALRAGDAVVVPAS